MQVETGSAITWKYPSVVLKGDNSVGEFYSVALTNNYQQVLPSCPAIASLSQHRASPSFGYLPSKACRHCKSCWSRHRGSLQSRKLC